MENQGEEHGGSAQRNNATNPNVPKSSTEKMLVSK